MKVTEQPHLLASGVLATADTIPIQESTGAIVYTLHRVAKSMPSPHLWPDSPESTSEDAARNEWSKELERQFHAIRRRARTHCPPPMLPVFEDELREIEAIVRGAITGRISPYVDVSYHIRLVEEFKRRWVPYIDPPPLPPPRVRYDETDRSIWLDGRCIAKELDRKQFGFLRALVDAYPDPLTWNVISSTAAGCLGGNQTRLRNSLPRSIKNLVESSPNALRLPEKMSTTV